MTKAILLRFCHSLIANIIPSLVHPMFLEYEGFVKKEQNFIGLRHFFSYHMTIKISKGVPGFLHHDPCVLKTTCLTIFNALVPHMSNFVENKTVASKVFSDENMSGF